MSSPRHLPAQTSLRAGLHSHKNSRVLTLLTSPHLPQVCLIDSRTLAHLRYAQMFSTEPFIIEIVWFNLYSAVLQCGQHLSPTLGENQRGSIRFCLCLTCLRVLPGTATEVEEEQTLMVNRAPGAASLAHGSSGCTLSLRSRVI